MSKALTSRRRQELLVLAGTLGLDFRNLSLFDQALTHTSYANEARQPKPHNERLEYLGDAVLELAVSTYLYRHLTELPEGELTKIRAGIVCSESLARLARGLHLGEYLLMGRGETLSGGGDRQTNLEDAFEAVIGAVYEDQGWEPAEAYVLRVLKGELEKALELHENILLDYKTTLQELVQKKQNQEIVYQEAGESGPDHAKVFKSRVCINGKVMGEGLGHSKKAAEQEAARQALSAFEE